MTSQTRFRVAGALGLIAAGLVLVKVISDSGTTQTRGTWPTDKGNIGFVDGDIKWASVTPSP